MFGRVILKSKVDAHVGQRIRELRSLRGISQEKLGQRIGIKFQQVQRYEAGKNRVSASKLFEIADVLSVEPADFFRGLGQEPELASQPSLSDLMLNPEAVQLVKLYFGLPQPMRRAFLQMVMALVPKSS